MPTLKVEQDDTKAINVNALLISLKGERLEAS